MKLGSRLKPAEWALFVTPIAVLLLAAASFLIKPVALHEWAQLRATPAPVPRAASILVLAFSPNSKRLLVGDTAGNLRCYDARNGSLLHQFHSHGGQVYGAAFSADGRSVAGIINTTLKVWDWPSGRVRRVLKGQVQSNGLAFSPDGSLIAVGMASGVIQMWNWKNDTYWTLGHRIISVESLAFSGDGKSLAVCCVANTGTDFPAETTVVQLWNIRTGKRLWKMTDEYLNGRVQFSPDNRRLAVACWNPRMLDASTGKSALKFKSDSNTYDGNFDISPDGSVLVSSCSGHPFFFCDTASGKSGHFKANRTINSLGHSVDAFRFSPNQRRFVQGGRNGIIKLWDVNGFNWKKAVEAKDAEQPPLIWSLDTLSGTVEFGSGE